MTGKIQCMCVCMWEGGMGDSLEQASFNMGGWLHLDNFNFLGNTALLAPHSETSLQLISGAFDGSVLLIQEIYSLYGP